MSATTRAAEVIARLGNGAKVGAEIGVLSGKMSRELLRRPQTTLYMVDNWQAMSAYRVDQETQDENYLKCLEVGGIVLRMDSLEAAKSFPDEFLDFVFIDADHSYTAVCNDIAAWLPKLRKGGLLGGHDYANKGELCGDEVKQAVDDSARVFGFKIELGKDSTWFRR